MDGDDAGGERVDIYAAFQEQDVDRIVEFLSEAGIEAMLRERGSSAFPMSAGTQAEVLIAVAPEAVGRSLEIIKEAIADELLSADGRFLV